MQTPGHERFFEGMATAAFIFCLIALGLALSGCGFAAREAADLVVREIQHAME